MICYTTTGHAEKGINSCSWNKYDEGRNVTLSNGTYFMFVANGSYQGTSSIDASAENYGFVAHMASPDDTSIQTLFGAELYQYSISFDIDWEMESGSANLEIIKKATDGSTYKDWDLDSYNMAGITYVIYDKSNNRVTSDAYTRGDKISVTRADQIVLSYDGVAYMNENGDNIVFVTPQSKRITPVTYIIIVGIRTSHPKLLIIIRKQQDLMVDPERQNILMILKRQKQSLIV